MAISLAQRRYVWTVDLSIASASAVTFLRKQCPPSPVGNQDIALQSGVDKQSNRQFFGVAVSSNPGARSPPNRSLSTMNWPHGIAA